MKRKLELIIELLFLLTIINPSYSFIKGFSNDEDKTIMQDTLSLKKTRLVTVISGASIVYVGSMAYLQYVWYKDHKRVPFEYYNDMGGEFMKGKFNYSKAEKG